MDDAKRSVNCSAREFPAAWWRGDAGPATARPAAINAGIPVDKKRDRKRLPHLLTERNADGELWCSNGAQTVPAFTSGRRAAPSMSTGHRPVAASIAAHSRRWA